MIQGRRLLAVLAPLLLAVGVLGVSLGTGGSADDPADAVAAERFASEPLAMAAPGCVLASASWDRWATPDASPGAALAAAAAGQGLAAWPVPPAPPPPPGFDDGRCGFTVAVRGLENPFRTLALFVQPEERLNLRVLRPGSRRFRLEADGRVLWERYQGRWSWTAPSSPGLHLLRVVEEGSGAVMTLPTFVQVPAGEVVGGVLNGYSIGRYPRSPLHGMDIYRPPSGYVQVVPELAAIHVSPHFTLDQFLCKEQAGWPRYLVLQTKLLLKLEYLLARVNAAGIPCGTFEVLSGYRTPLYNRSLGYSPYSRHCWGGAADIYVDADGDGVMDDLDGNGRLGDHDAAVLCDLVEGLLAEPSFASLSGGLGRYPRLGAHGPFVHIDVRGWLARWGL